MNSEPIEITVGGAGPYDPAVGASQVPIAALAGHYLRIEKRNVGTLKSAEWLPLQNGGFALPAGVTFQGGEVYFIYDLSSAYELAPAARYSNGLDTDRVMASLFGRIGWRSTIQGAPVLSLTNTTTKSRRYFSDFHPLCSPAVIRAVMDDPKAADDAVNQELEILQRAAIMTALNAVLNEPEILETGIDFDPYGEVMDIPVQNAGLFTGRRIFVAPDPSITVQVDAAVLYFDADVTLNLYLFQEGNRAPIWSQEVQAFAYRRTKVDLTELYLSYLGASNLGGCFYLGYFQDDLPAGAHALNETRLFYQNPANTWRVEQIQAARIPGQTNFNRSIIPPSSPWTNGLQLQLSAFRDFSQVIIKKAGAFDNLIGLTMAATVLQKALNTFRSNTIERVTKDQLTQLGIYQDLTGVQPGVENAPRISGLRSQIDQEAKRVKRSFYPCSKATSYTSEGGLDLC